MMRAANLHQLARTLREIALLATGNVGEDRVSPGELAVLEDVARNPGATIGEITRRTGLAQSLISRITRSMAESDVLIVSADAEDRRKVRIHLAPGIRDAISRRASNNILPALTAHTVALEVDERAALEHHLSEADRLLRENAERLR